MGEDVNIHARYRWEDTVMGMRGMGPDFALEFLDNSVDPPLIQSEEDEDGELKVKKLLVIETRAESPAP